MFAALPPIAGSTPIQTPINEVHSSRNGRDRISQVTFTCDTARTEAALTASAMRSVPPIFSASVMICANANTPISTGRNSTPPSRNGMPKVSRGTPIIGSLPSTVTTRPNMPAIRPFSSDASTSPATIESASTKSEKYSHGPNLSANAASGPVAAIRKIPPSNPP